LAGPLVVDDTEQSQLRNQILEGLYEIEMQQENQVLDMPF
jgi:hypothetical protein